MNVAEPALPVFTSAHGEDSWEPDLISRSAEVFFESMDLLEKAQNGILSAAAVLSKISEMHSCEDARREEPDIEFWSVPLESPES
ncbi:MAG: hypothetical protein O3A53_20035 [Acidobacteria bacterium]|nr:hypothetical protein [Acidobacteriota bacterium]MDA1237070.1 hypothetical protein [Acidobacteriota bacterium]